MTVGYSNRCIKHCFIILLYPMLKEKSHHPAHCTNWTLQSSQIGWLPIQNIKILSVLHPLPSKFYYREQKSYQPFFIKHSLDFPGCFHKVCCNLQLTSSILFWKDRCRPTKLTCTTSQSHDSIKAYISHQISLEIST